MTDNQELGRSGADAPSGCQSSGPQPPTASSQSGIPNAEKFPPSSYYLLGPQGAIEYLRVDLSRWHSIESLPEYTEALVCVTYKVPAEEDDNRPSAGDGYVWETVQWVDWYSNDSGWFRFPRLIEIPFPPTRWTPLPSPPASGIEGEAGDPKGLHPEGESPVREAETPK